MSGLDLGAFGIYTFDFEHQPASQLRDSVQQLEDQGWPTIWVPELLGRDAFTHAGYLLCERDPHGPSAGDPRPGRVSGR